MSEVLKRLPGIDLTGGSFSMDGKEIKRIFVNGKEYEYNDLNSLLENIPAEVVNQIQVADWVNEAAQMSGEITETSEKIIHLQYKEEYSSGIISRLAAGLGLNNLYNGNLFLNLSSKNLRATVGGQMDNGIGSYKVNSNFSDKGVQYGLPRRNSTDVNLSYDPISKLSISGAFCINEDNILLTTKSLRTSLVPNDSVRYNEASSLLDKYNIPKSLNLRLLYKFNDLVYFKSSLSTFNTHQIEKEERVDVNYYGERFNRGKFERQMKAYRDVKSEELTITNAIFIKFKKKRRSFAGSLDFRLNAANNNGLSNMENIYTENLYNNLIKIDDVSSVGGSTTTMGIKFTEPISRKIILIGSYNISLFDERTQKEVFLVENNNKLQDSIQSQAFSINQSAHRAGFFFQYATARLILKGGIESRHFNRDVSGLDKDWSQQISNNYTPSFTANYEINGKSKISFRYQGTLQAPQIGDLQPVPNQVDSFNIFIGNPNLLPELKHRFNLFFNDAQTVNRRRLWAQLNYTIIARQITKKHI